MKLDYIHAPGCTCAVSYAADLAAARRLAYQRYTGSVRGALAGDDISHAEAWALYACPDGSCPGWARAGQDWPFEHVDTHVLALYRAAIALRGAGVASWEAVAAARRIGPGSSHWTPEERAADIALVAAHHGAEDAEREARAELADAICNAHRGRQPDGSYITDRAVSVSSARRRLILHAPGRGGPLAEVLDDVDHNSAVRLVELRTVSEARAIRDQERAESRAAAQDYEMLRADAYAALRRGEELSYRPGQQGGTFRLPSGKLVSAPGALRGCIPGLTRGDALEMLGGVEVPSRVDGIHVRLVGARLVAGAPAPWPSRF